MNFRVTFEREIGFRRTVGFCLNAPGAKSVALVGAFNQWEERRTPMWKDDDGIWRALVSMPVGRNQYQFVVDGQWVTDPNAREQATNPKGQPCSIAYII